MNANDLLTIDHPITIVLPIAKAIGLNEAIVLQRLHELLNEPGATVERGGHTWVRSTYEQWHDNFPFWSIITIKRIFNRLEKEGIIITRRFNKSNWDQTKYYRIDYRVLDNFCSLQREEG